MSGWDKMQPARLWLVGLVALTSLTSTLAHADRLRRGGQASGHYFVDFRARPGGVFGHTYVVYGRMDERGRVLRPQYAGLYPGGAFSQSVLLALLVVPGRVSAHAADHKQMPKLVYRRRLSPAAYERLTYTVHVQRKTPQTWDLLLYNCNSFAADVASSIGMRTPPTLEFPTDFVRDLYVMNRVARSNKNAAQTKRLRKGMPNYRDALYHFDSDTGVVHTWR